MHLHYKQRFAFYIDIVIQGDCDQFFFQFQFSLFDWLSVSPNASSNTTFKNAFLYYAAIPFKLIPNKSSPSKYPYGYMYVVPIGFLSLRLPI